MKKPTPQAAASAAPLAAPSADVLAKMKEREQIRSWLKDGKSREMELRKELVSLFVPKPVEGTNNVQGVGFALKVTHKIERALDEAALDAVMAQFPENSPHRLVGNLISYKPTFNLAYYRSMSAEDRKIFDQALTIKDGSPELEIIFGNTNEASALQEQAKALDRSAAHFAASDPARSKTCVKAAEICRTRAIAANVPGQQMQNHIAAAKAVGAEIGSPAALMEELRREKAKPAKASKPAKQNKSPAKPAKPAVKVKKPRK